MLELEQIKEMHDKAFNSGQTTREKSSDDMVFYHVTQWDDALLGQSQLQYRGEFNILRKAGRQIISDLRSNPVQVDFQPKDEDREDGAEFLDGVYRTTEKDNTSIESFDNASMESVVCGIGGWLLYSDYESLRNGSTDQVVKRKPIYEANNTMFFDPNAKMLDKSDANYCSLLESYSEDGYKDLHKELTGEETEIIPASFSMPEHSYTFPWFDSGNKKIHVAKFFHREIVKDKVILFLDPFGGEISLLESTIDEHMNDLVDHGYSVVSEKKIQRPQVTQYIVSGEKILKSEVIAGDNIPVVPTYGERAFIEGEEHYEGITRLAKDPQRLRNFQMSYLADIVSRSPRRKPVFLPEQIQGFEHMYEESGADNNYPYLLQNRLDSNGNPLPVGAVGEMPEQSIPQALAASIALTREAVEDVANPGLPQNIADPDLSGKAVIALQNRMDMQSQVYQQNIKHAKRRDGVIYASMASVVYDAYRTVTTTMKDGSRKQVKVMDTIINDEGEQVTLNDITNMEFDVYSDIGPSYSTKKEQTVEMLSGMIQTMQPGDPLRPALILKQLELADGTDFDDIRKYARNQLLIQGIREPETDEDFELLKTQSEQQGQPDAGVLLAQAEMEKANAQKEKNQISLMSAQTQGAKTQSDIQSQQVSDQVDIFNAQTKRHESEVKAAEVGANIRIKQLDAGTKRISALKGSVNRL